MKADLLLVEKAKKGESAAFSELVMRHQKVALRLALRMTRDLMMAEDVVQDSFLKAYQKLHTFEGRASFKSWLFQITANTAKNKLRERVRDYVDIDRVQLGTKAMAESGLMEGDLRRFVKSEVAELPPKQKMALSLRIFDEMSFKEIAEVMGCPYDTAKANYRHAIMKLRHRFSRDGKMFSVEDGEEFCAMEVEG